jgi:putative glutamine amidotransferase
LLNNFHFKGIYHSKGAYDYSLSVEYLEEQKDPAFSLFEIHESLPGDELYAENSCTPVFEALFSNSRGAIFPGGPDIPPHTYNEAMHLLTRVTDPGRHYLELSYLFHILGGRQNERQEALMKQNPEYGVLGICLGMQSINVATGGSMVQDIPLELYGISYREEILKHKAEMIHRNYQTDDPWGKTTNTAYHFHPIKVHASNVFLSNKEQDNNIAPLVLSAHHQAIEKSGKGLISIASSLDGKIVEAVVHEHYHHVIGVQFHPEKTGLFDPDQEFNVSPDSTINFNQHLLENNSLDFHLHFWREVSGIFKY